MYDGELACYSIWEGLKKIGDMTSLLKPWEDCWKEIFKGFVIALGFTLPSLLFDSSSLLAGVNDAGSKNGALKSVWLLDYLD